MPSGCEGCARVSLEYFAASQAVSNLISQQKVWAMRHKFEKLPELDRVLEGLLAERRNVAARVAEHYAIHQPRHPDRFEEIESGGQ
jgi:hypothetical protein